MRDQLRQTIADRNLSYHIETYGCQMNTHESEKIAGVLDSLGYCSCANRDQADLVLFNTCCVRQHAEERLSGNLGVLKDHKSAVPGAVIGVCGCMMQQPGAAKSLMRRFHFVDLAFGSNHIHHLPDMLADVLIGKKRTMMADEDETVVEGLPVRRSGTTSAFVNIIYGCNNFCTYCVVPYVRGRERSRSADDILDEVRSLAASGVREITLLGQNVNSFGKDTSGPRFPELLQRIDGETDIARVRFMTSHPKDLTDDLIACYGSLNSLCEHIHLPVQSGSSRILQAMNRRYTREQYLGLVHRLRERVPDIAITTDIIVGFPGETQADFDQTLSLVESVGYDAAFTFAYSPRALTKAAEMDGQLSRTTKSERLAALNALVAKSVIAKGEAYVGKTVEVLVESASKQRGGQLSGKTRTFKTVNFSAPQTLIGQFVSVKIDKAKNHTLHGVLQPGEGHHVS